LTCDLWRKVDGIEGGPVKEFWCDEHQIISSFDGCLLTRDGSASVTLCIDPADRMVGEPVCEVLMA